MTEAQVLREMDRLRDRSVCALHPKSSLSVRIVDGAPVLWCGLCNGEPRIERKATPATAYIQGDSLPAAVHQKMAKKIGERIVVDTDTRMALLGEPDEAAIAKVKKVFALAQPNVEKLPMSEQIKVAQLVAAYGIQPFHVHVQGYTVEGTKVYSMALTHEGRLYCARHENSLGANFISVTSTPLSKEQRELEQIPDGQSAYIGEVRAYDSHGKERVIASDIGRAGKGKDDGQKRNPIALAHPQEMARTRAERRALAKAAPLGLIMPTQSADGFIDADELDDDIIEGEATVIDDAALPTAPEEAGSSEGVEASEDASTEAEDTPMADTDGVVGEIDMTGPANDPFPEGASIADQAETKKLLDLLTTLDYKTTETYAWLKLEDQDISGLQALGILLRTGWSAEQITHSIIQSDPNRQPEPQPELPWQI